MIVPLDHSTWYSKGQATLVGGGDQDTTTSGGVATVRMGLTGAPGQAGRQMGGKYGRIIKSSYCNK